MAPSLVFISQQDLSIIAQIGLAYHWHSWERVHISCILHSHSHSRSAFRISHFIFYISHLSHSSFHASRSKISHSRFYILRLLSHISNSTLHIFHLEFALLIQHFTLNVAIAHFTFYILLFIYRYNYMYTYMLHYIFHNTCIHFRFYIEHCTFYGHLLLADTSHKQAPNCGPSNFFY